MLVGFGLLLLSGCMGPRITAGESETDGAGADSAPDIGDGTLDHDLLVIAQTQSGPFYFILAAQRTGDTFEGHARSAFYIDGVWTPGGVETPMSALEPIDANEVPFEVENFVLPAGFHPFGPDDASVEVYAEARIAREDRICGALTVSIQDLTESATFVAVPVEDVEGQPAPDPDCE